MIDDKNKYIIYTPIGRLILNNPYNDFCKYIDSDKQISTIIWSMKHLAHLNKIQRPIAKIRLLCWNYKNNKYCTTNNTLYRTLFVK